MSAIVALRGCHSRATFARDLDHGPTIWSGCFKEGRVSSYNQELCEFQGRTVESKKRVAPLPETTDEEPPFKPLTADQARRRREQNPPLSPWWVVAGQAAVGILVALVAWAVTGRQNVGWSAGYGALAVVIPAAIFARGLTGRFASLNAATAAFGFMVWEMVKIATSIALLAAAPRLVPALSWPALLVGMVLTMKVYWVALAYAPRKRQTELS
jgi:ATP synthase protein I